MLESKIFAENRKKLINFLRKEDISSLILIPGPNLYYATGLQVDPSERLIAAIIPIEQDPTVVCPSFEEERIRRSTSITDIQTWEEDDDPFELLKKCLSDLELTSSPIGLDPKFWFEFYSRLVAVLPQTKFVNGGPIMEKARITKSKDELNLMQRASSLTTEGILKSIEQVSVGMTESEVGRIVSENLFKLSSEPEPAFCLVQSGPNSAIPHGSASDRSIEKNDILLIDAGTTVAGYHGDITITTVIGDPSEKFKKIYEIVLRANRVAFEKMREGVPCEDLDKVARDLITSEGFGEYFTHRLGHGLGLEVHEHPYIVNGNKRKLKAGMTHTIEPGIYLLGKFGVRIEDNVVVTKDGAEWLSNVPREI